MLTAAEIRNVKFSRVMSGYKQDEVDVFLDKIEADYVNVERTIKEYQAKIEALNEEINEFKASQNSIQSVLISAQTLADNIVKDAKAKSEEIIRNAESSIDGITMREKELAAAFEMKAQESRIALEKELEEMVAKAKFKADSITAAAEDSVARQQMLFDKLKAEIAAFKTSVNAKYKQHLELLSTIPDTVPADPKYVSAEVLKTIDQAPDIFKVISSATNLSDEPIVEPVIEDSGFVIEELVEEEEI